MNLNLGTFDTLKAVDGHWYILRNGQPMMASFGSRDEALKHLEVYAHEQVRKVLLGL